MTSSSSTVITEDGGRQNLYAAEPRIEVIEGYDYWKSAEMTNGRMAMIGFFALVHNYILFGGVIPGIF